MNTKKILLYGGGALFLGAVGFFVWSFFQKENIPVANTKDNSNLNSDSISDSSDNVIDSTNSIPPKFNPNINNPFQPLEDNDYSDLDTFIHKGV